MAAHFKSSNVDALSYSSLCSLTFVTEKLLLLGDHASHLTTQRNRDLLHGLLVSRAHVLNLAHDVQAFDDFAEDGVFAVEMGRGGGQDEELAAVGVGAGVLVMKY